MWSLQGPPVSRGVLVSTWCSCQQSLAGNLCPLLWGRPRQGGTPKRLITSGKSQIYYRKNSQPTLSGSALFYYHQAQTMCYTRKTLKQVCQTSGRRRVWHACFKVSLQNINISLCVMSSRWQNIRAQHNHTPKGRKLETEFLCSMQMCIQLYKDLVWKASQILLKTSDLLLFGGYFHQLKNDWLVECLALVYPSTHCTIVMKLQSVIKKSLLSASELKCPRSSIWICLLCLQIHFLWEIGWSAHQPDFFFSTRDLDQRLFTKDWVRVYQWQVPQVFWYSHAHIPPQTAAVIYRFRL